MEEITNKVFGKMIYDFQWEKTEEFNVWGSNVKICIAASAFPGESITSDQEKNYSIFKKEYEKFFTKIQSLILEYVNKNFSKAVSKFDEIKNNIEIKSVLFKRDGSVVILADCPWDGNGIGIQIIPKITISTQDAYL